MSHAVSITRTQHYTTSTTTASALILNTGYLKSVPGLLKLAQLVRCSKFFVMSLTENPFLRIDHRWSLCVLRRTKHIELFKLCYEHDIVLSLHGSIVLYWNVLPALIMSGVAVNWRNNIPNYL
jgi:hypothetical protein